MSKIRNSGQFPGCDRLHGHAPGDGLRKEMETRSPGLCITQCVLLCVQNVIRNSSKAVVAWGVHFRAVRCRNGKQNFRADDGITRLCELGTSFSVSDVIARIFL